MGTAALDNADLPPMRWNSATAAFRWAEETASRPNYRSPAGILASAMVGNIIGGNVSGWTGEDYRDLAHSILAAVAVIPEPFPREMFRYVYGDAGERLHSLGGLVGESLMDRHPKKNYSQLRRVGEVAVINARGLAQHRAAFGKEWYARALGIKRPSLYDGEWMAVIANAEDAVLQVLRRGKNLARNAIEPLGVLGV